MNPSIGGYIWAAILSNGSRIDQFNQNGREVSVDSLPPRGVSSIHLVPYNRATHAPLSIEIPAGQPWKKFWRRTVQYNTQTTEHREITVDVIGFSNGPYLYIYPDGSILFSKDTEH